MESYRVRASFIGTDCWFYRVFTGFWLGETVVLVHKWLSSEARRTSWSLRALAVYRTKQIKRERERTNEKGNERTDEGKWRNRMKPSAEERRLRDSRQHGIGWSNAFFLPSRLFWLHFIFAQQFRWFSIVCCLSYPFIVLSLCSFCCCCCCFLWFRPKTDAPCFSFWVLLFCCFVRRPPFFFGSKSRKGKRNRNKRLEDDFGHFFLPFPKKPRWELAHETRRTKGKLAA